MELEKLRKEREYREREKQRLVNGRIPDNDKEMIVALATLNKDNPIGKTINAVKTSDSFNQNMKNLGGIQKDNLRMTYAYLAGLDKNDNNLLSLKVEGLKIMVLHHLKLVMPQDCLDCKVKY